LTPLFGATQYMHRDSYVDADSTEAYRIRDGLLSMKGLAPSQYDGQSYSQVAAMPRAASGVSVLYSSYNCDFTDGLVSAPATVLPSTPLRYTYNATSTLV
jgi:hypothetical protein